MRECAARIELPPVFSEATRRLMRAAVLTAAQTGDRAAPLRALRPGCAEAHDGRHAPEHRVLALKAVGRETAVPAMLGALDWDALYRDLLTTGRTVYFEAEA